jgi:hypothetical protein
MESVDNALKDAFVRRFGPVGEAPDPASALARTASQAP